jgi:hypothetical protein
MREAGPHDANPLEAGQHTATVPSPPVESLEGPLPHLEASKQQTRSILAKTEIVFDQGLGDLFIIRVAGNIVASSQIGSMEFAANGSAHRSLWCWVTRDAELFLPRWKSS